MADTDTIGFLVFVAALAAVFVAADWQPRKAKGDARAKNHPRGNAAVRLRRLLVYCSDHKCSHSVVVDSERWGDNVRLSDLEPRFTCGVCGRRGADVRPLFERVLMETAQFTGTKP